MAEPINPLWSLVVVMAPLSLASVGGGVAILPAMQHDAVDVQGWMTAREFVDLFAIARLAPGPGSMLVTLVGWKVAGWLGAIVATIALLLPSSVLCYAVARTWSRHRGKFWHTTLERAFAPLGTGLICGGMIVLFNIAGAGPASWAVAAVVAAIMLWRPKFQPLIALFGGGALFAAWTLVA
jgi:chromate transporter